MTLVILFHSSPLGPVSGGSVGVDIFFVPSAFVIMSILAKEWRIAVSVNVSRFYW